MLLVIIIIILLYFMLYHTYGDLVNKVTYNEFPCDTDPSDELHRPSQFPRGGQSGISCPESYTIQLFDRNTTDRVME